MVIDTNSVLDLWVFQDAGARGLLHAVTERRLHWIATSAMRDELARVLDYPLIAARLDATALKPWHVLAQFDAWATLEATPTPCPVRCRDVDDQMFINLAAHHGAVLVSKDARVLELRRRLAPLGVDLLRPWPDEMKTPSHETKKPMGKHPSA